MIDLPSKFESAALAAILAGAHPVLQLLRGQLSGLRVTKREETAAGFFADLGVDPGAMTSTTLFPSRLAIGDVEATIAGLRTGAGIVVFVDDGRLTLLEGFTYDEPWPGVPDSYSFRYRDPSRAELYQQLDQIVTRA